ncbi:hypothetical protein ROZALSC1DRAFT_25944, partial [Rozella allomycis CSF55]
GDKVEIVSPPSSATNGDRIVIEGVSGEPEAQLNPKKDTLKKVLEKLSTTTIDSKPTVVYLDDPLLVGGGSCTFYYMFILITFNSFSRHFSILILASWYTFSFIESTMPLQASKVSLCNDNASFRDSYICLNFNTARKSLDSLQGSTCRISKSRVFKCSMLALNFTYKWH